MEAKKVYWLMQVVDVSKTRGGISQLQQLSNKNITEIEARVRNLWSGFRDSIKDQIFKDRCFLRHKNFSTPIYKKIISNDHG
jgi:hypothetical protein